MCDEKEVIMDKMVFVFHIRISHWNPMKPLELQTMNGSFEVREHPITDNSWVRFSSVSSGSKLNCGHIAHLKMCRICQFTSTRLVPILANMPIQHIQEWNIFHN